MPTPFTSPVGRIVQGDVFDPQTTDQQGRPRVILEGPRAGQPNPQWFIAVAFPKNDPAWPPFKAILDAEAAASWPSLHPGGVRIPSIVFSDKIIDGDGYDTTGKHNGTKEGFAGCWVVRFTSGFAPKTYRPTTPGVWVEVTDPKEIKRGYYVRVAGSTTTNKNPTKPGIHVNLGMVELIGQGPEIISGPSAADAFAAPAALPPGASALPPPGAPTPGAPAPPASPAAPPPPPPPAAPYTGFMHPHDPIAAATADGWLAYPSAPGHFYKGQDVKAAADLSALYPAPVQAAPPPPPPAPPAAPPPPPPPPAAPVGPQMTAKADGQTHESMIAGGWTDALLVQHGYMVG